jgi:ribosome-associated toxin RatA of RatAB toxin-antitoxin module
MRRFMDRCPAEQTPRSRRLFSSSVPTFERSIDVAAPREPLFWLMQDYTRRLEWDPFLSEARLVGGATKADVGVRAWCVDQAGRGMETEYVSFKPPAKVAVKMTKGPWMFASFAGSWAYDEKAPGRTTVTFRYHVEARPRLGRLTDFILERVFAKEMDARLDALRVAVARGVLRSAAL